MTDEVITDELSPSQNIAIEIEKFGRMESGNSKKDLKDLESIGKKIQLAKEAEKQDESEKLEQELEYRKELKKLPEEKKRSFLAEIREKWINSDSVSFMDYLSKNKSDFDLVYTLDPELWLKATEMKKRDFKSPESATIRKTETAKMAAGNSFLTSHYSFSKEA